MNEELKPCPFCGECGVKFSGYEGLFGCEQCDVVVYGIDAWNRRASVWIPVGERYPEDEERVIVWTKSGRVGVWYLLPQDEDFEDPVTHWQPLPEPPQ